MGYSSIISDLEVYLPGRPIANAEVEARVNHRQPLLPLGTLERLFGAQFRHFAAAHEQTSDLAAQAAMPLVERVGRQTIDFLIFASASQDLMEPATANIVQQKLALACPVMDVKNACNSFVSALQTADAMIRAGMYANILIVTGERLSSVINFELDDLAQLRQGIAALSLGDAGTAVLVSRTEKPQTGLQAQRFLTLGNHWPLCTVKGGGSMFPHDPSRMYFEGKTRELGDVIRVEAKPFVQAFFDDIGHTPHDFTHIFTHQVAASSLTAIATALGLPSDRIERTFAQYGNTAAASIPLAVHHALREGRLKRGDSVLLLGLAAGISVSVQFLIWE